MWDLIEPRGDENRAAPRRQFVQSSSQRSDLRTGFSEAFRIEFVVVEMTQHLNLGQRKAPALRVAAIRGHVERNPKQIGVRTVQHAGLTGPLQPQPRFLQSFTGKI